MHQFIDTTHCRIAVETAGSPVAGKPAILFIHGNSSCKEVFAGQMNSDISKRTACFAMDLPGHGRSEDAKDPEATYTMTGYAKCALELISQLHDGNFVVVGWSLGGHIGIEMTAHTDRMKGLLVSGTPPVGRGATEMQEAFLPNEHMAFTGQEVLTDEQAQLYARTTCGSRRYEDFLGEAVRRTDGRARRIMMEAALRGDGVDQREVVETADMPLAIVNGREEALVNNAYVQSIDYANLWRRQVFLIDNAGHAPFWDEPQAFNSLLGDFLEDVSKGGGQ